MFKVGDYVTHVRQGPGRIVDVRPEQILIQQRGGHEFRVNIGLAETISAARQHRRRTEENSAR